MSNENVNPNAPNPGTKEDLKQKLEASTAENAELLAQVEQLKAMLAARESAGQEPMETETAEKMPSQREKIFIPRAAHSGDDHNFTVCFNGKLYILPRGKESEVPAEVAAEIRRSWRAADRFDDTRARKLEEVAQAEAQMKQLIG